MAEIRFEQVGKIFPGGTVGVEDLDLEIADGEFMVLVGPSGSGKSTALRILAGLESTTSGRITIGGRDVTNVPPRDRDIAMVFQNYALYPHMTVAGNMGFALSLRKVPKDEIRSRVQRAAEMLGIANLLDRKPKQLSGGQRQRVAMGRAIVREPSAFLMDEPLSNLDAKLRVQVRAEIAKLHQTLGTTTLYVTHDQVEAMTLGDRVAVMRKGCLQQVDPPQTLYERPVNLFVAGFIGSPAMNMVPARLEKDPGGHAAVFGSHRLEIPEEIINTRAGLARYAGKDIILGIRPETLEDVELVPDADPGTTLQVHVQLVEPLGAEVLAHFEIDAPPVLTEDTVELAKDVEDPSERDGQPTSAPFTARLDPRTAVADREAAKLFVDTSRLYFFDPSSGEAIW